MLLPKSVRAQSTAADERIKTLANPEPDPEPPREPEPGPAPKDPDPAPSDPEGKDRTPDPDKQPVEPKEPTEDRDAAYWRHRAEVVMGKYNAEVPALNAEIKQLKQTLADKDQEIDQLKTQAPPAPADGISDEKLAEFRETFGEELVDFVTRMIEQRAAPPPQPDTSRVDELDQRVSRFEQEKLVDREARFWTDLDQAVPDWREINTDPKFLAHLAQFDPESGRQRQELLDEARQQLDAKGVSGIFLTYQKSQAPRRTEIPPEDVEPRTSRSTSPAPQGGGGRIWTGKEIGQFYRDKTAGRYTKDEAQRLEADIFAAQQEGRVRP